MKIDQQPTLINEFHLSVASQFEEIPARILDPPRLKYARSELTNVTRGSWHAVECIKPIVLEDNEWAMINLSTIKDRKTLLEDSGLERRIRAQGQYQIFLLL